jgi:transcriptional regulator with XRE-family HTH domain
MEGKIMDLFSERLKLLRSRKGITQDILAESTGMTKATISRYENGVRKNPGRSEMKTLANYFGVSLDYLDGTSDIEQSLNLRDIESEFYNLTDDNKLKVISYIRFIRKEQDDAKTEKA